MGSLGAMPVSEVQRVPVAGTQEEEAVGGEVAAVLDFDMLCATVALQTQGMSVGKSRRKEAVAEEGDEDDEMEFGGVQRMWEGDVTDCFDDRRIAIQAACCPCYRFGMNMRRANLGSCFLQATAHSIFIVAALFSFIAFVITNRYCFLYMAIASTFSSGLYLGHFRTRLKKQFNIRVSIYFLFIIIVYFLLLYFIYHNQLYFSLLY
ncbi:Cys-rich domain containing protein [Musa troglodytarum]|uniref:Cys-rich domain containing protein n=1 Tax=Musa troglodytarum TaxID=320322 RepID=A0A9E7F8R9_9LILI|nr:Cys-rich domain containing protein [Musa troglodytarum]